LNINQTYLFSSVNSRQSLRARLEAVTISEIDRLKSSDSLPSTEVRRVDRERDFTIDDADSYLRQSSWDGLAEKAQDRAQDTVRSNKGKPYNLVRIVESTEVSNSRPDRKAEEARGAMSLRNKAVDSGYRVRIEMDNVSLSSISSLSLLNKLLRVSFATAYFVFTEK
jgi:hypothetical protein